MFPFFLFVSSPWRKCPKIEGHFFLCLAGPGVVELSGRQTLMGIALGAICSYWAQLSLFKLEKQAVAHFIK